MKRHVVSVAALLLIAVALPASAATFASMSFNDLVDSADAVVVARVTQMSSSWTESGRLIVTENKLKVEEVWAGDVPGRLSVRTPGGEVGGFLVEAHGFPNLQPGEHVILFLSREPNSGTWQIEGHQLGHYRIVTRLDGVTLAVPQVEDGVRFIERDGSPMQKSSSRLLSDFKAAVMDRAAGRGVELR